MESSKVSMESSNSFHLNEVHLRDFEMLRPQLGLDSEDEMDEETRWNIRTRAIVKHKRANLDDGYYWRKYGQRNILGSKYPRAYFRCINRNTMGCLATRQVQRDEDDPTIFCVTYKGAHRCNQQMPQASQNMAQEEELQRDRQNATASDAGESKSRDRSEITFDSTTKSQQSEDDQPSRIRVVSESTSAAKRLEYSTGYTCGMVEDRERVISLLQSDSGREHSVSVVSMVGDEGAGKTTLARLVYDDPIVCEDFELRSWVCLTRVVNVEDLLKAMIKALTTLCCHHFEELSELQEILKEEVTSRKYLLVLDNIRDVQILESELLTPLRLGGKGSKILVTSQEELFIDTNLWITKSYKLNGMSEDVCWRIMKDCAFYNADTSAYPNITEVQRRMVPRCEGKPLAARTIGGILRAKVYDPSTPKCDVLNNKLWKPRTNESSISLALRLSCNLLPEFLRKCLIYCSLFPKGYIFEENYLIRLWMAQGYIDPQDYEEEEIGREYLNELLRRSFLQRSRDPNFPEQFYELHDLIYDLLQKVCWMEILQGKYYKEVHILSSLSDKSSKEFEALQESPHMQSLLVDRYLLGYSGRKKIQILSSKILSDLLDNLVQLNALDLSFSSIKELPNSLGKLKSLCYLGLNNSNIRQLPATLCDIYNLQTLELQNCVYLQLLPEEINRLINLIHLDTRKRTGFIGIPHGLGRLTKLRTLSAFSVAEENQWHSGIGELNNLVNLRGDLCIGGLKHVMDGKEAEEANLNNKEGIESLTLQWSTSGRELESDEMDGKANEVLENLKPHGNLKQLVVRDYTGDQFPGWIRNPSSYKLISLTLDNCRWCKKLPPLGRITSLKHLFIRRMDSVQSVGREFLGYEESVPDAFLSLETLKIWEMYNLEEWYGVKGEDFPCLRSVSISRCFKLWSLPCLPTVVELTIHGGIEVPILSYLPSMTSLSIEGFQDLKTLMLQPGLTSVLKLELKNCSQLSSLLGLRYSKTLREIKLDKCPVLDLESEELPLTLEVVSIHRTCSLLSTWCPSGFHENVNSSQAIRRRLVKEKQQKWPIKEKEKISVEDTWCPHTHITWMED